MSDFPTPAPRPGWRDWLLTDAPGSRRQARAAS